MISGGPQDSKFCVTVNMKGSTEYRKIFIGGPQPQKVENRWSSYSGFAMYS